MRKIFLILILSILFNFSASYGAEYWAKTYGGRYMDYLNSIEQTTDGGYIIAGSSGSFTTVGSLSNQDIWVLKLDAHGDVVWQKTYPGSDGDASYCIQQTTDGGFILTGYTWSYGAGTNDMWVIKLDPNGEMQWSKTYGGNSYETGYSIRQTNDGGYIVAGTGKCYPSGYYNFWLLRLDAYGNVIWQKILGQPEPASSNCIQQTADGGYVVTGFIDDAPVFSAPFKIWVLKFDKNGNIVWQKKYTSFTASNVSGESIQQTVDGGYVVTAYDERNYSLILKLDENGNILWQKKYEGVGVGSIQKTSDMGYVAAGGIINFSSGADMWLVKLDGNGTIIWQKAYGGAGSEGAHCVIQTSDGGYALGGVSDSFGTRCQNMCLLKLDEKGDISPECNITWTSNVDVTNSNFYATETTKTNQIWPPTVMDISITPHNTTADVDDICNLTMKLAADKNCSPKTVFNTSSINLEEIYVSKSYLCFEDSYITPDEMYNFYLTKAKILWNDGDSICSPTCVSSKLIRIDTQSRFFCDLLWTPPIGDNDLYNIVLDLNGNGTFDVDIDFVDSINAAGVTTTLVELSSFTATPLNKKIALFWSTASEIDNAGFNIYRSESEDGEYVKIREVMIPAEGSATQGASYEFADKNVKLWRTYFYKLEDIDLKGKSTMHGPVSATPRLLYGLFQ